jgi:hypothetical protein
MIVPIYAKVSINDYNREGLSIDVDLSLPARRVIQSTPPLLLAVFHLAQNVVVHYYKPITTEWLNFVQTQLNQINEDPSTPALLFD